MSRAQVVRYAHNDVADLRAKIIEHKDKARRMLIITDGVFSMDGDIAPLPDICDVADEFGAMVMVDDAHGEGVLGDSGRGIVNHFKLEGRVEVEVGTLSKAFGVMGGYVTGEEVLIEYLKRGRPFSTGLTADTAAAIAAVDALEPDALVKNFGTTPLTSGRTPGRIRQADGNPITPVMLGDEKVTGSFPSR